MSTLFDMMNFMCKINIKWRKKFPHIFMTTASQQQSSGKKHFSDWAFLKGQICSLCYDTSLAGSQKWGWEMFRRWECMPCFHGKYMVVHL